MDEEIILEGTVESIIFADENNGYMVFALDSDEEKIVCTGYVVKLLEGEAIKAVGSYIVHPSYGRQFNVKMFEKVIPTTEDGIQKYLASGVVKGIGPKLAKRIVDKFGTDTFHIIEEFPESLAEIKGITLSKAMSVSAVFHEQADLRRAMLYLQDFGISPVLALKIYKRYKGNSVDVIKTNPYSLASEIFGVGFKTADSIASKVGIELDSPYRIKAGIKYCLSKATSSGHVYLPKDILVSDTAELLEIPQDLIEDLILELHIEKELWIEEVKNREAVFLNSFYFFETYTAKKLLELSMNVIDKTENTKDEILIHERNNNITLDEKQKEAVLEAMSRGVLVITGGPGTGKTTTINTIISILEKEGYEIELAAPTGRAAKRMTEATGKEAKTIHRLLGISFINTERRSQFFEKNEDNPIETDVIIIDETSMVDIALMNYLLRAIAYGTRLILVGDVDQLPSVGAGNVLKDIIESGCVKVVCLSEIFRQARESAIVVNAHKINKGEYPILNQKEKDFFFIRRNNYDEAIDTILELVTSRLPKFKNCNEKRDIQVLSPMRKSPLGVANLNKVLQQELNPPHKNKKEKESRSIIFREGDKVMQLKNNYNTTWRVLNDNKRRIDEGLGVFNGDEGELISINHFDETITVLFDENKFVDYDFSQLDELDLAYALTIHKSQGSEYRIVVIPILGGPPMLLNRNLLYTAVTRAKELCVIVGKEEVLYRMVDNKREIERFSSLDFRMKKLYNYIV